MLDWLNNTIGTDIATYIGVFLAFIGFFMVGKKISNNNNNQKQSVKNGTGIQVGGDLIIGKKDEPKSDR